MRALIKLCVGGIGLSNVYEQIGKICVLNKLRCEVRVSFGEII